MREKRVCMGQPERGAKGKAFFLFKQFFKQKIKQPKISAPSFLSPPGSLIKWLQRKVELTKTA